jgi:membrane-associated phospholipid phosphatase
MTRSSWSWPRLSRRTLVASTTAGMALAPLGPLGRIHAQSSTPTAASPSPAQGSGASPSTWRTWILSSPDDLRPAAPAPPTQNAISELIAFQADRSDEMVAAIKHWNTRPAVLPWTEIANAALSEFKMPPVRQARAQGMLQAAMYDAVIAAYDAQTAYSALLPAKVDADITPLEGLNADSSAYPSAEAAVAGAASTVLAGILPDAVPNRFSDLANESTLTRLQTGLNFRRDIDAGMVLGEAIGKRALAHGADDQPGTDWDGSGRLEGPGYGVPTPPAFAEKPLEPLAGTWKLWVMSSADQFLPAPPPAYGSPAWKSQLAAVQEAVAQRTFIQAQHAKYWQNTPATTLWNGFASDLITRDGLDLPHAARVLACLAVAQADAQVANYEAKYTYWTERPITSDPKLDVLFPTPPFPSYPSSHATVSNAGAIVLVHLFPDDALDLLALGEEAAASRGWAGIHFPIDNDAGLLLGRNVGYLVADVARHDGAE